jgi:REP element-mobilizing transposase RayT
MPQSLAQVYIHLIFSTKGRAALIPQSIRDDLCAYLGGVLRALDSPMQCVAAQPDHVHIVYRQSKNLPLAKIVEKIKTASSKWVKTKDKRLDSFHWQNGYAAFSVSASRLGPVRGYVETQAEHHRTVSFQDELRRFFAEYHVEYDERYVWD